MLRFHSALLLALLCCSPLSGQGAAGQGWSLLPDEEQASAWQLALWAVPPYAELQEAGLPLPPTAAELAPLSAARRMQEQRALKAVWLERLIRAREERSRVSRENLARAAQLAGEWGAPAAFVEMLRLQASGSLPYRQRHLLESAQECLLRAYGVDAREMRFFVEGSRLSAEHLRDVVAWLPLPALFNLRAAEGEEAASAAELQACGRELIAVRTQWLSALRGVSDQASADAAAEALLPALARYQLAMGTLLRANGSPAAAGLSFYAQQLEWLKASCDRERSRMLEHSWYGSHRLQVLDYLLH